MKKSFHLVGLLLLVPASLIFYSGRVSATVGGPTYISAIGFKVKENALYYTVHDNGGRGCPPIVRAVDLATQKDTEVKSCDQIEREYLQKSYEQGLQKYNQFISDAYQDVSYLGSVSLKKNNISVRVELLSEHRENNEVFWNEFRARLMQNGKQIGTIDFRGCFKDQPHVFEGYKIPDSDMMAILVSNKGDCFEGGYVKESLFVVRGVVYHDSTVVRSYKTQSPTEPNLGNIIAHVENDDENSIASSLQSKGMKLYLPLAFVPLVIGFIVGYLMGKGSRL
jgi:hypothetical protein